jgi:hypothetical protein
MPYRRQAEHVRSAIAPFGGQSIWTSGSSSGYNDIIQAEDFFQSAEGADVRQGKVGMLNYIFTPCIKLLSISSLGASLNALVQLLGLYGSATQRTNKSLYVIYSPYYCLPICMCVTPIPGRTIQAMTLLSCSRMHLANRPGAQTDIRPFFPALPDIPFIGSLGYCIICIGSKLRLWSIVGLPGSCAYLPMFR